MVEVFALRFDDIKSWIACEGRKRMRRPGRVYEAWGGETFADSMEDVRWSISLDTYGWILGERPFLNTRYITVNISISGTILLQIGLLHESFLFFSES